MTAPDANDILRDFGPDGGRHWFDLAHAATQSRANGHARDRDEIIAPLPGWVSNLVETEIVEDESDPSAHSYQTILELMNHGLSDDDVRLVAKAAPFSRKLTERGAIDAEIARARASWSGEVKTQANGHTQPNAGGAENEEEPLPLYRSLPAADPFPTEALGGLEDAARALQAQTQAPIDMSANSVLATCSLACQPHADIELPTGEAKPLSSYFITVAPSGERKTSNDARALVPVKEREEELRQCYEKEIQSYLDALDVLKAERHKTISNKNLGQQEKRDALARLGKEPKGPLTPVIVCHEPTIEGLARCWSMASLRVGCSRQKVVLSLAAMGSPTNAKLRTAAGFSMLWDDGALTRVRVGDGVTASQVAAWPCISKPSPTLRRAFSVIVS